MLHKSLTYALIGAAVVGGGYMLVSMTGGVPAATSAAPETPVSFADQMRSGKDLECTISVSQSTATVSGTIRIAADGRLRGDFSTLVAGREVPSALIVRDGSIHVWGGMMPRGIKAPAAETSDILAPLSGGTVSSETVQHECHPWSVDESVFALPDGIEFIEAPTL